MSQVPRRGRQKPDPDGYGVIAEVERGVMERFGVAVADPNIRAGYRFEEKREIFAAWRGRPCFDHVQPVSRVGKRVIDRTVMG